MNGWPFAENGQGPKKPGLFSGLPRLFSLTQRMVSTTASLDWLQTLADSTRVRLLRLLEAQELSVSELCSVVQLPQSTVSRHLKVLSGDRWISGRRDGTNHLYRTDVSGWCEARQSLWDWVREQADTLTGKQDQQRLSQVLAQRSRSQQFFHSTAEQWDRLRVELFGKHIDSFVLAASLPADSVVGELGCGSAPLCRLAAPFVRQAIAVDSSQAMLAAARQGILSSTGVERLSNIRLVQAELSDTTLDDDQLDTAWLVLVLPYIDNPVEVLQEAKRVLKPGASLIVVDLLPHDRAHYRLEMGHLRQGVSPEQLAEWFTSSGLQAGVCRTLPPDPAAKGPALFAAVAYKSIVD